MDLTCFLLKILIRGLLVFASMCFFLPVDTTPWPTHLNTSQCGQSGLGHQTLETVDLLEDTQEAHRDLYPQVHQVPAMCSLGLEHTFSTCAIP